MVAGRRYRGAFRCAFAFLIELRVDVLCTPSPAPPPCIMQTMGHEGHSSLSARLLL